MKADTAGENREDTCDHGVSRKIDEGKTSQKS